MRSRNKCFAQLFVFTTLTLCASAAFATEPPPAGAAAAPVAPTAPPADKDGARFRGGISAGGGGVLIPGAALGAGGLDFRLGAQINDLIGVYAQPHLTFASGSAGFTGTGGGTAVVDFTFFDKLFAGAGGGFGIVGSISGPELHFRLGGYPIGGFGENGIRRKGLMLAADMRMFFTDAGTVLQPMASIGYEAF